MSQLPTADQQHQNLLAQEQSTLAQKAQLLEQLEQTNAVLASIRAALQGIQLGAAIAAERTAAALKEAETSAPTKE